MKILWVKAGKILPVDTGGKIRSYNLLRYLHTRHDVTFLSYYGGKRDEGYEKEIGRELPGAVAIHVGTPGAKFYETVWEYARAFPSRHPFSVARFTSRKIQHLLAEWIAEGRFDVAICDFLAPSLNFPSQLALPTVLFQHNVEGVLWRRQAETQESGWKKLLYGIEAARMERYESSAVRRFHHVIAVSEKDRQWMGEMTDVSRISVVPTGVDLGLYRRDSANAVKPLVVFTGSMDWRANIDGVAYFCREIWPAVEARVPDARFRIVGRYPPKSIRRLASGTIEVTGAVPSITEHLREAAVVVVPLRIGGGTRLKIYEAMAMGKVVVSTTVGAEGLNVHHGVDIMLCDDPKAFGEAVVMLLEDASLREKYGQAAAQLAAQYDWPVIADQFAEILENIIQPGKVSSEAGGKIVSRQVASAESAGTP
ncbi:MAG TPA: glycosyltransferase family 4 protein [Terriglobia bacterium]|nr:glycosyltransferase family 4 protein [Terriglobia bacterium]